jgi:predicted PurR-regulated permease PerM
LHNVVLLLFVAIVISTAIKPAVDRLQQRGVRRSLAVGLVFLLLVILVTTLVLLGAPLVAEQSARIGASLPMIYNQIRQTMLDMRGDNLLIWRLALAMPDHLSGFTAAGRGNAEDPITTLNVLSQFLTEGARLLFGTIFTFILAIYWTLEGMRIKKAVILVLPQKRREEGRALIVDVENRLGSYVTGEVLLMIIIGIMSLIVYLLMGLPYALVLAIVAGLMEAVPLVGPGLGAIPAALVAYSVEPTLLFWVIAATLLIQQVENNLLVPRIMKRTVGVNPLVTLLALLALGSFFGIVGAVVAVPAAAITQLLFDRYVLDPEATVEREPGGRDRLSVLRYETQELMRDVRRQAFVQEGSARNDDDGLSLRDSLEALAVELDDILAQNGKEL